MTGQPCRVYRSGDHLERPWRNGAGTTREVAQWRPEGADIEFVWRLSFATVDGSSAFSTFPGIDRVIVLTEGEDLTLTIEGREPQPLSRFVPFSFPGEAEVASVSAGRSVDFNVMTHRDHATAEVTCHRVTPQHSRFAVAAPRTGFLAVLDGSLSASEAETGQRLDAGAYDVVRLGSAPLEVNGEATVALVTIQQR